MYKIIVSHKYLRDLKRARKRGFDESKLNEVISILKEGDTLPSKYKDHPLISNYKGYRECHITPDWLLIYSRDDSLKIVGLARTGTHSDLF